jgi:pyridoxal phosphate enzyme (YggS family)
MRDRLQIIADNVAAVRHRVAEAATKAGRDPATVQIVSVSKYVDRETTALLLRAGCESLGESRPQSLWEKALAPELASCRWHLIGRLQRNKIRRTLPLAELIHSVDSQRLLAAIDEEAAELNLAPRVLLEVNCSGDEAKQGFTADGARAIVQALGTFQRVRVEGFMTMAPLEGGETAARDAFSELRTLRDELLAHVTSRHRLDELSMGMSGDFGVAIAEGATIVRIGSLFFEGLQ